LNPEAGACLSCPRRTGYNTQLFADVQGDTCLDASCYRSKVAALGARETADHPALIQISTEWRPATDRPAGQLLPNEYRRIQPSNESEAAEPVCPHAAIAIVTHGDGIGTRLEICADQDFPVHRPKRTFTPDLNFEQRMQEAEQEREERKQQRSSGRSRYAPLSFASLLPRPSSRCAFS